MSEWLREVESASYSVQYTGPAHERSPLIAREAGEKCVKCFWIVFLTILFCAGVGIGSYLIIQEDREYPTSMSYTLISRSGWRALPPNSTLPLTSGTVTHVAITQTGTGECDSTATCGRIVNEIQREHVYQRNLSDIAYNFLVAGDGATYEGRGWGTAPEIGEEDMKEKMVVVAFIGNFVDGLPQSSQIEEFKVLTLEGVARGAIDPCFTINLFKDNAQDGAGQMVHVFNRLVRENIQRKSLLKCS